MNQISSLQSLPGEIVFCNIERWKMLFLQILRQRHSHMQSPEVYVTRNFLFKLLGMLLMCNIPLCSNAQNGIATKYPGDAGIQNAPGVIFTDMFEAPNISAVISNWTDHKDSAQMALVNDVPPGSSGKTSIRFTTVGGRVNAVDLYKLLSPGIKDSLFLRYYIKYNSTGTFHHTGGAMGGYNPPSGWTMGSAGKKPTGSDRFSSSIEPYEVGTKPAATSRIDYYAYWMGMKGNTVPNTYYGNCFINDPAVEINLNEWACIEIMIKLNNPVTASNGEMALWINGVQVSHLKQGSPTGAWVWDKFIPGTGTPFEGFQWRNNTDLNINWLWIEHYVTEDKKGQQNSIYYDHVVAARSYIGPISMVGSVR